MERRLARLLDVPLAVDASLNGPTLRIRELITLKVGSVISTSRPVGDSVEVFAGAANIGSGELDFIGGRTIVRMVKFNG